VITIKHVKDFVTFQINEKTISVFRAISYPKIGLHPIDSKNGYIHVGHKIIELS
jgi:hypothetical protein